MRRLSFPRVLPGLLLLSAATTSAQTVPLDVVVGYRFLDLSGNRDMYRSQIDERSGVLLHSLTLTGGDLARTGLFDHVRLDATELGIGPVGGFRLEAGRANLYRLRASYQKQDLFSALPGFANPFLSAEITPGQHTYDRTRHLFDAEIELLPGGSFTPIVGYTRNSYAGPGRTTYHVGQDEFRLSQDLRDLDQEVRLGASFAGGPFTGQIIQGWRKFSSDETLTLAPGESSGNNPGPILGVPETLTSFTRRTSTDVNTPTTSAFLTTRITPRLRFIGSYTRARGNLDTIEQEDLTGNLVSFEISRFFQGLSEPISSHARSTQWTGSLRAEVVVADGVDLETGYVRRHRELGGFALISSLFLNTVTFAGADRRDVLVLLQAQTAIDRTEEVFEANLSARGLGPVALRAGWSQTDQDLSITPDPSEIVVPGGQGGVFNRTIKSYNGGATFSAFGVTAGADYRGERADRAVVRTDFRSRDRYRLRAAWGWKDLVRVSATAEQIDVDNDDPGIALDGRVRQYGGDLDVSPVKPLHVRFAAGKYQADNTILILRPQDLGSEPSVHREDGTSYEGSVAFVIPRVDLQAGYGRFKNEGVFPFVVDRVRARAEVPVNAHLSGVFEWSKDKYSERATDQPNLGNFDANRYGFFVRWRQ